MPSAASTKDSIKQAARLLFARHGVDAVTVRDIVQESGTRNASALNYYFGSKEELVQALIQDAMAAANARWDEALDELERNGGPKRIRQIVEILVFHGVPPRPQNDGKAYAGFFATLLHTRRHLITENVTKLGFTAYDRAFRHLRELMPPMPLAVKNQRLLFYFWSSTSILAVLEDAMNEKGTYSAPWSSSDPLTNFVEAAIGMLEAPHTRTL